MARKKKGTRLGGRSIVSLLICAAIGTEWVRSRSHTDMPAYFTPAAKLQGLAADRDGVMLFFSGVPWSPERGFSLQWMSVSADDFEPIRAMLFDPTTQNVHQRIGFKAAGGKLPLSTSLTPKFVAVMAPYWFLLIVALLPTMVLLRAWATLFFRRRRGECLECGYDLRASGPQCPECGAVREGIVSVSASTG